MTDLNTMMRDQARAGLQVQLDTAVTNGDTEAARKIADQMNALAVQTAPKAPPYGDVEIRAALDKQEWFGTDPKKSKAALELGKNLDPKKFANAEAFAAAVVKAVEEEFKPATPARSGDEDPENEDPENEDPENEDAENEPEKPAKKGRRTDGPNSADSANRSARRASGPWTKLTDAPAAIQTEIKRAADKFVPANAAKERRESFIAKALESQYAIHQRTAKGKK